MASLSQDIKRLIGQHFVFGFHGQELSEDVKILVRDFYVGSIILMKRNVGDARQVWSMVRELQHLAKESGHQRPLLIGVDQENGLVSAFSSTATDAVGTQFPGAMALSATGSPDLAEQVSAASAKELKLCGINWAYSPVADVNTDPRNPVIGVRSFGDDPVEVREYAEAVSRGLTSAGIASSAKHAPGHGNTNVDSHLALPLILKTKAELHEMELIPFQGLINAGIPTIMTGHMALPLLTDDSDDTPSSLSRIITTDLIRGEMGFKGVIVTDCLEMEAVAQLYGGSEGAGVLSLQAGADIAMICHTMERQRGAVEKTYDAVASGLLSVEWLRESGDRIDALKDAFVGTWEDVLNGDFEVEKWTALKQQNAKLSKDAYAASTALVCDPLHVLPIKGGSSLVFTPVVDSMNRAVDDSDGVLRTKAGTVRNTAGSSFLSLFASVSRRTDSQSQHVVYSALDSDGDGGELPQDVKEAVSTASSIIFATRHDARSIWQIDYLRKVIRHLESSNGNATSVPVPVVVLASCAPYDLLDVKDLQVAYVSSFEFTPPALEAATAVIFGEREAKGRVPVLKGRVVGSQC